MTISFQDEQRDRRDVNDRLREQQRGATLRDFAQADADTPRSRFSAHEKSVVIGSTPLPSYPEQPTNSPFHHDPVGQEPPLGFPVDQMPPVGEPHEVAASLAVETPSPPDGVRIGYLFSRDIAPSRTK
jgi:hypothetical protein